MTLDPALDVKVHTEVKRLFILCDEPLLPVNHGGRVDIWNRYVALQSKGWILGLFYWRRSNDSECPASPGALSRIFSEVLSFELKKSLPRIALRLIRMARRPSLAAARVLEEKEYKILLNKVREFAPSLIICERIFNGETAYRLAKDLGIPHIIRSHNIEHRYFGAQFCLASSVRTKITIGLALWKLKRFELFTVAKADGVFEISYEDAGFWRNAGQKQVYWIPTILPETKRTTDVLLSSAADRPYDAVYVGNLWAPNNVSALTWFIENVVPKIVSEKNGVRIVIAGSSPSAVLKAEIARHRQIELIENPADVDSIRRRAKVLFNPIMAGSGLNTKTIEMLFFDAPLVVTTFGVHGMAPEDKANYVIADDAEEFARAILLYGSTQFAADSKRLAARERYGAAGAVALEDAIFRILSNTNKGTI